jgi:hypothetical protein
LSAYSINGIDGTHFHGPSSDPNMMFYLSAGVLKKADVTYTSTDHDDVEITSRLWRGVTKHCAIRSHSSIRDRSFRSDHGSDNRSNIVTTTSRRDEQ